MKVIIDTNIVLDYFAEREPFVNDAEKILIMSANREMRAAITANTITDIAYVLKRYIDKSDIRTTLKKIMEIVSVIEVNYNDCISALHSPMADYEDAILAVCAQKWKADCIVTRNIKDFTNSPVKAISPDDFLKECQTK